MIVIHTRQNGKIVEMPHRQGEALPDNTIWVDLQVPEDAERAFISKALNINLPTLEDIVSIETSSRLFIDGETIYVTMDVVAGAETPEPELGALMIAWTPECLVTMRSCKPKSVSTFASRIKAQPDLFVTTQDGLIAILDAISDRIADILESLGAKANKMSQQIFRRGSLGAKQEKHMQDILLGVGRIGDTNHMVIDSISGMVRLITFLTHNFKLKLNAGQLSQFQALERDVHSLNEHAQFVQQEASFLLDATLGQINIEQNNIIKILSIVMVAFTPPTFLASLWGMNFHNMPEYNWAWGYGFAWIVMIITAIVPVLYFRKRGWL